jgi:hypothetical protein
MGRQPQGAPVGLGPAEDLLNLRQGNGGQGIRRVDDHRDTVKGDGNLHQFFFLAQQLPGRGPQVGGPLGGGVDTGAGAAPLHIDADRGMLVHIDLGQFFRERLHRSGAGDAQGTAGGFGGGLAPPGPQEHQKRGDQGQSRPPAPAKPPDSATAPNRRPGLWRPGLGMG